MFSSPCTTGGLRWVGDHLWVSQSPPCTQTSQCADLESCSEWHQPAQGWGLTSEKNPIFWWGELILVRSTCSSAQGKASWCDGCVMQILQCSFLQPTCCLHLLMYFLQPWSWRESSFETNILFYKHSREWKKKNNIVLFKFKLTMTFLHERAVSHAQVTLSVRSRSNFLC